MTTLLPLIAAAYVIVVAALFAPPTRRATRAALNEVADSSVAVLRRAADAARERRTPRYVPTHRKD